MSVSRTCVSAGWPGRREEVAPGRWLFALQWPGAAGSCWRAPELGWALQAAVGWNSRQNWRVFHVAWALTMAGRKVRERLQSAATPVSTWAPTFQVSVAASGCQQVPGGMVVLGALVVSDREPPAPLDPSAAAKVCHWGGWAGEGSLAQAASWA